MFSFKNSHGRGKGMVRLVNVCGVWKAHMLYTCLQELDRFPEASGLLRPDGGNKSSSGGIAGGNWYERRQRQLNFLDEDPDVLIIGAGQSGLNLGARLQTMGLSTLLVDKNQRVGDNWRYRYRTLVTHDPIHDCHMAYLFFPVNWPRFTPKDKLADWFESYASLMELNIWMSSSIESAEYSDVTQEWRVRVQRGGVKPETRKLRPKHVVFCTGQAGEPRIPSFPGQQDFAGLIYHGSQNKGAALFEATGKRVVVVGTGNSGHDISQNYYENGAHVTMLQRRGTYVITANPGLFTLHTGVYEENGPATEDADIYGQSLPIPVQFALNVHTTSTVAEAERAALDGLARANF